MAKSNWLESTDPQWRKIRTVKAELKTINANGEVVHFVILSWRNRTIDIASTIASPGEGPDFQNLLDSLDSFEGTAKMHGWKISTDIDAIRQAVENLAEGWAQSEAKAREVASEPITGCVECHYGKLIALHSGACVHCGTWLTSRNSEPDPEPFDPTSREVVAESGKYASYYCIGCAYSYFGNPSTVNGWPVSWNISGSYTSIEDQPASGARFCTRCHNVIVSARAKAFALDFGLPVTRERNYFNDRVFQQSVAGYVDDLAHGVIFESDREVGSCEREVITDPVFLALRADLGACCSFCGATYDPDLFPEGCAFCDNRPVFCLTCQESVPRSGWARHSASNAHNLAILRARRTVRFDLEPGEVPVITQALYAEKRYWELHMTRFALTDSDRATFDLRLANLSDLINRLASALFDPLGEVRNGN